MSSCSDFDEGYDTRFLLPQGVGDTEDVERYEPGGFHPVHLGDRYDGGRYRVAHKLGAGIMTSGAICWRHCPRYQNTKLLCSTTSYQKSSSTIRQAVSRRGRCLITLGFISTGPIMSSSTTNAELGAGYVLTQSPIEAYILVDEGKYDGARQSIINGARVDIG